MIDFLEYLKIKIISIIILYKYATYCTKINRKKSFIKNIIYKNFDIVNKIDIIIVLLTLLGILSCSNMQNINYMIHKL